jgi:DNA-binding SARP family transcriptional activator
VANRIVTRPGGYSLRVEAGELDVARFEGLASVVRAARQAGHWDQVTAQARAALSLWRGDPLADAGSQVLAGREAPRLGEMRLQVLEARLDADVRSGGHAAVIPELYRLVKVYPLREHLHATLMLALYRCGQQGDALAAYRAARHGLGGTGWSVSSAWNQVLKCGSFSSAYWPPTPRWHSLPRQA